MVGSKVVLICVVAVVDIDEDDDDDDDDVDEEEEEEVEEVPLDFEIIYALALLSLHTLVHPWKPSFSLSLFSPSSLLLLCVCV